MMIGNKLREARHDRSLSLTTVATKAKISAATLSRIENDKQGVELGLFVALARILNTPPHQFLVEEQEPAVDPLAVRIAALRTVDRATLWRDLAAERRVQRTTRRTKLRNLCDQLEELAAQIEFLREEIENVRAVANTRR